ncbi:hypothetical protein SAY87_005435 [Trapa incisa]|uniref:Uncharacterized protein n=1 Tax=Trapa incisa TaxID=236973 RepID=A0AAN7K6F8_9MYRT|nr:hypothetical protein SAY87_005435 [Trapa incisa]
MPFSDSFQGQQMMTQMKASNVFLDDPGFFGWISGLSSQMLRHHLEKALAMEVEEEKVLARVREGGSGSPAGLYIQVSPTDTGEVLNLEGELRIQLYRRIMRCITVAGLSIIKAYGMESIPNTVC